ncbi:hypothetical protein [uncultured Cyclobacterium sp.]|uniref:hypothetical protein n=1 Tax=uncultured Cyclobacterium sp. TaxID=453820 RepID=UPI0030EE4FC6|tara:strand:- start:137446 stop:139212 length:1767 start_codon:yes stop_codon:yes gene_type:complete
MIFKSRGLFLLFIICLTSPTFVGAQDFLLHEMNYVASNHIPLGDIMDELSKEQGFYFSYQSSLINLNEPVSVPSYEGQVAGFLRVLLGEDYEFKEHDKYVIIKYAPGKLDIDFDKGNRASVFKGKVRNLQNGEPVPFASIYEKNTLVSSLSDENGDFELKFKKQPNDLIWLTISKEAYRDTSFIILPTVDVGLREKPKKLRFYPENGVAEAMENSALGRLLIGFRQRVQRLNFGGFFVESPMQVSLTPGLSSQGFFNSQMINNFSLNILGGYTAGVEGLEIAGIFNINQKDVKVFQVAGIFNMTGGDVDGFQASGIHNFVYGNVLGFQVGGIYNHVKGDVKGGQVAGIYNFTDGASDIQIGGLLNKTAQINVLQIAGLSNHANTSTGAFQIAGLNNYSKGEVSFQIAGLVNKAEKVTGAQFSGLINIAKTSDYPIGLFNFIEDGKKSLSVGIDETGLGQVTFRSGGRKLFGIIGTGMMERPEKIMYGIDFGLGLHVFNRQKVTMDFEFVNRQTTDFSNLSNNTSFFRLIPGFKLGDHFSLEAGPSVGFTVFDKNWTYPSPGYVLAERATSNGKYTLHAGFYAGVQYEF